MDKFKEYTNADSIAKVIITKRPLSKTWGFPAFVLKDNSLLRNLFGPLAYDVYAKLSESDKKTIITWYETHGEEVTHMYGGEFHEDWDGSTVPKRDLQLLKKNHPKTYEEVVKNVAGVVYGSFPKKTQDIIIKEYIKDPVVFEAEISRNE